METRLVIAGAWFLLALLFTAVVFFRARARRAYFANTGAVEKSAIATTKAGPTPRPRLSSMPV